MSHNPQHKKALSALDITLYTISAILLVDQIALSAAVGASAIFWWLVVLVLFFIPNTLVTAELGTRYPEQGGIYAWIRDAFGTRWGARITWLYWINIALWMPAVFIMFGAIFSALYWPQLSLWGQIGIGLALCWLTAAINCLPLRLSKWIPNLGTPLKFLVILTLGIGGLWYGLQHGFANDLSLAHSLERLDEGLAYIPVIVYGCLGVELISAESGAIRNPHRNIPRAMLVAGLLTAACYIFGTLGVLAAVPAERIDTVDIIAVSLRELFASAAFGETLALSVGGAALLTFFSTMVTWTLGGNCAMAEAGAAREMPAAFAKKHPQHGAPVGAALLTSALSSSILLLYGIMAGTAEELFWNLFSFSAIIFLMPYVGMHLAYLKLRRRDAPRAGCFRVPGTWLHRVLACNCILILGMAIALFFWVPGEPLDWYILGQVGTGVLATLLLGEYLVRLGEKARKASETADPSRVGAGGTMGCTQGALPGAESRRMP
ncbi:APC family permease [Marinobacterium sedimentorum]|uniref:APC family permease n=1 Tax=Marinobacterium sedimentorum TaxID=2927804 RepID=UPI0020C72BCA|nr:APC family permease [Marinobacterium sedimentorum]MCP8687466.1 APC family permease [Marinobacterium sedimentorum]